MSAHPELSSVIRPDYCRSCDGYSAEVGKLDESGCCERCTYRNALETISNLCEESHKQIRGIADRALKERSS